MGWYLILAAVVAIVAGRLIWRRYQFNKVASRPFTAAQLAIVRRQMPAFDRMPADAQAQLLALMRRFVLRKQFVGCAGLEVTEEMRITVAAYACLLLLNRKTLEFERVGWIYMYPADFIVWHAVTDEAGVVSEQYRVLSGEAWHNGRVILSWDAVESSIYDPYDGHNVVLHEFAHQLDAESGSTNGAPLLQSRVDYVRWAEVMTREFERLEQQVDAGEEGVIDDYGATNEAEFFAVITETFFEQPVELAEGHPELFDLLRNYYKVDPRTWMPRHSPEDHTAAINQLHCEYR